MNKKSFDNFCTAIDSKWFNTIIIISNHMVEFLATLFALLFLFSFCYMGAVSFLCFRETFSLCVSCMTLISSLMLHTICRFVAFFSPMTWWCRFVLYAHRRKKINRKNIQNELIAKDLYNMQQEKETASA